MNKISFIVLIGWAMSLPLASYAQKIALKSGSLESLNTVSEIRLEFTYDNMMVGKSKEADYVSKKVQEYNSKEPGKGDQWLKNWVGDRETKYQPRFQEGFNNFCMLASTDLKAGPNATGKIRMVVHTTFTEPGYNIYMSSKNASINAEVIFFDETNAGIAKVTITNSPGNGFFEAEYDTRIRIQEAYANAGRALAAFILEDWSGK